MSDEDVYKDALRSIMQKEFRETFRSIILEEFQELMHIKQWKASQLLGRPDFPVIREAGVLIHRDKLFQWIDRHTQWVEEETDYVNSEK